MAICVVLILAGLASLSLAYHDMDAGSTGASGVYGDPLDDGDDEDVHRYAHVPHSQQQQQQQQSYGHSPKAQKCENCIETVVDGGITGACCYGDHAFGTDYTESRCHYAWAGPNSSAEDCKSLVACCHATQCTNESHFSCFDNGGKVVTSCNDCVITETPTTAAPSADAYGSQSSEAATVAHYGADPADTGCCCKRVGMSETMAYADCHACGGHYMGDGTECGATSCVAHCCDAETRACGECENSLMAVTDAFVGFFDPADGCPAESCGVTCCVNAQAHDAASTEDCDQAEGTVVAESLEDAMCGGGCCAGGVFSVEADEATCLALTPLAGEYQGDGVGYVPGICGGGCCVEGAPCSIMNMTMCDAASGVFQGNDTTCDLTTINGPTGYEACENDGCCCVEGSDPKMTRDAASCHASANSVFIGEGTTCTDTSCKRGVCCFGGRAGRLVDNRQTCEHLPNGVYAGDGTRDWMENVCDTTSGACWCPSKNECVLSASADACRLFSNGRGTFQGVGTDCVHGVAVEESEPSGEDLGEGEDGACCYSDPGNGSWKTCDVMSSGTCAFKSGVWHGASTECSAELCSDLRGSCCVDSDDDAPVASGYGAQASTATSKDCYDHLTFADCTIEKEGRWNGPHSLCSDEHACDASQHGACCREGHACSRVSAHTCKLDHGFFQGSGTTCQDLGHGICKVCQPCIIDAPPCSESTPCENPALTCVREYGKCMAWATPIETEYDYWLTTASDATTTIEAAATTTAAAATTTTASTSETTTTTTTVADATTEADPSDQMRKRAYTPDEPEDDSVAINGLWAGPLTCGDKSTLGMPCMASPLLGKCRIGVCSPPPEDNTLYGQCESVCRHIKQFPCGCECGETGQNKCASVGGVIAGDASDNHADEASTGVGGAVVTLANAADGSVVATQHTSAGGHYVFAELNPGQYVIQVALYGCYAHAGDSNYRFVELQCLHNTANALRAMHQGGAVAVHHNHQSLALEENARSSVSRRLTHSVDFGTKQDCGLATKQTSNACKDASKDSCLVAGNWASDTTRRGRNRGGDDDDDDGKSLKDHLKAHGDKLKKHSHKLIFGLAFLCLLCSCCAGVFMFARATWHKSDSSRKERRSRRRSDDEKDHSQTYSNVNMSGTKYKSRGRSRK